MTGFTIENGSTSQRGGGIKGKYDGNTNTSATISKCIITNNSADFGGGISDVGPVGSLTVAISNCIIYNNSATSNGGGIVACHGDIINCLIYENWADDSTGYGGGMNNCDGDIINCTIVYNTATTEGGGLRYCDGAITNCIVWGNGPDELYNNTATFTYNCIKGWTSGGTGNITDDPKFVNAGGDDYHLRVDSLCINGGHPSLTYTGQTDVEGNLRKTGSEADIGAYECIAVKNITQGDNYGLLQNALAGATSGDELWVMAGTHYPDRGDGLTLLDRTATFQLVSGVGVYGGFDGAETARSQRDMSGNLTILSGDIDGNNTSDSYNSYNVVVGAGTSTTIIDGFTITMGYADHGSVPQYQSGGGMYNDGSSPTVTNCIFDDNYALFGGGMSNISSSPTVTSCTFTDNSALIWGGAMDNYSSSSPTITDCTFSNNTAINGNGGAILCDSSGPTIEDCNFSSNAATNGSGGGMCNSDSSPTVTNCIFDDNDALYGGGMSNDSSSPTVTNCTFTYNAAVVWGGGMDNYNSSSPTIIKCLFNDNEVTNADSDNWGGGGIMCYSSCDADIVNCTITRNTAANCYAGGVYSYTSSPTITNTIFWNNTDGNSNYDLAAANDGIITLSYSNVTSGYYNSVDGDVDMSNYISTDPLFKGDYLIPVTDDFHLMSAGGRWNGSGFSPDPLAVSPCINEGEPYPGSSYSSEPTPNGGRINMGAYGNTTEASKTGYGSLRVTLTPSTAKWRRVLMGDSWYSSGYTLEAVVGNNFVLEFQPHAGYVTPSRMYNIDIYPETLATRSQQYDPL